MPVPVYTFTGFLDAGKTKFIQETLCDTRFNAGERTLLIICEEGEEEFDSSAYPYQNVYPEVIDQSAITTQELEGLLKKHRAERGEVTPDCRKACQGCGLKRYEGACRS